MLSKSLFIFMLVLSLSCGNAATSPVNEKRKATIVTAAEPDDNPYHQIKDIPLPEDLRRIEADSNSFASWLRNIVLKKDKTVFTYDGNIKANQSAQFAVLDISVGNKNLQQCADAVMRLRAEYLFAQKRYDEIIFRDNENHAYIFNPPYTRANFTIYLEKVFGWCGSASLSKQLKTINDVNKIEPGDVLIRGGFPGHAVIVVDVAQNSAGKKYYMLAQSYMPAQDIHILLNPMSDELTPWYEVNDNELIQTPEYLFRKSEWKRW